MIYPLIQFVKSPSSFFPIKGRIHPTKEFLETSIQLFSFNLLTVRINKKKKDI